jgi:hypothetical protein
MRPRTHENHKVMQNLLKLLVIVAALILVVFILIDKSNSNANTKSTAKASSSQSLNSTTTDNYSVLPPATVAPKVAECSQTVNYDSDGVPSPLQCSNGYLNTAAWNALSAQEPKVMSLGYNPAASDLQSDICSDIDASASDSAPGADDAIETSVFQISALYYGWNSAGSISNYIANCPK